MDTINMRQRGIVDSSEDEYDKFEEYSEMTSKNIKSEKCFNNFCLIDCCIGINYILVVLGVYQGISSM